MRKTAILLTMMIVMMYGCTHDHLSPNNTNPPGTNPGGGNTGGGNNNGGGSSSDTVCFQTDILPLYQTYCASTGCHTGKANGGDDENFSLSSYADIKKGIVPFNPGDSRYFTIIQSGQMPPGHSPKLSAAQINTITKWINQGALNNTCATSTCDTTKTTYTNGISQIFATYCNGCHGVAPGSGNVVLSDYNSAKAVGTSQKTTFIDAINYRSANPAMNMPPAGQLSSCQVTQITKWLNAGCPQ